MMLRAKLMLIGSAFFLAMLVGCEQQGPAEGGGTDTMQQQPGGSDMGQQPGGTTDDPGMQQQDPAQSEPGAQQ